MVGTLSVVGSSAVDCHTCPCLCVVDGINYSIGRKQSLNVKLIGNSSEPVVLSSSFVDTSIDSYSNKSNQRVSFKGLVLSRSLRKYRKSNNRRLVVVNELGGQYEDTFSDVKTQILNYFTYKAVRTVLNQLYEMNPTQYRWFYDFVAANKPGDGKRFIRKLGKEKHELAERVMVTRLHLYGKWVKKCDHAEIYKEISDENLELMRERLMETVIWPSDDTNTERIG